MKQYKISKKTVDLLYSTVYEEIIDARLQIYSLIHDTNDMKLKDKVDELLSDLSMTAPQKAIKIFEK